MVYSSGPEGALVFGGLYKGGSGILDDMSAYNSAPEAWTLLAPAGRLPSARSGHVMAYNSSTGLVYMFGGFGAAGDLNDTWVYVP